MANQLTIPELPEIELADVTLEDFLVLDNEIKTFKLKLENLKSKFYEASKALTVYASEAAFVAAKGSAAAAGDTFFDSTAALAKVYNGASWTVVVGTRLGVYASTAAFVTAKGSVAAAGDTFFDSTAGVAKVHNGSAWTSLAPNPMSALGDLTYGAASGVPTNLAGSTTAARRFLRQLGTGLISAAPAWDGLTADDIVGRTDGAAVTAGRIGQTLQIVDTTGSAVAVSTSYTTIVSLSLTPGVWFVGYGTHTGCSAGTGKCRLSLSGSGAVAGTTAFFSGITTTYQTASRAVPINISSSQTLSLVAQKSASGDFQFFNNASITSGVDTTPDGETILWAVRIA